MVLKSSAAKITLPWSFMTFRQCHRTSMRGLQNALRKYSRPSDAARTASSQSLLGESFNLRVLNRPNRWIGWSEKSLRNSFGTITTLFDANLFFKCHNIAQYIHFSVQTRVEKTPITAKSRFSAMTDITNDRSFPQFGQLPKEVRLIIWEMALPRPRVVDVRMRSLKKTYLQWKRETEDGNETMENASYGETTLPEASGASSESTDDYGHPRVNPPLLDGHLVGIKSNSLPPQILLASHESLAAATKFYERVFFVDPSFPETYFNFNQDTLYIRHDTFSWYSQGDESILDGLICFSAHNDKDLNRVRSLAVLLDPRRIVFFQEWLVELLGFFRGVERLSCVVQHYDRGDLDSPLCLIEPIDVDAACINHELFLSDPYKECEMPEIPRNNNAGLADMNLEVLEDAIQAEMGQDYVLPIIEFQVVVTQDFKEHLDSLRESVQEILDSNYDKL